MPDWRILGRLRAFLAPGRAEHELSRELGAHLQLLQDELERRGMTADEARRAARLAVGGVDQVKERHRDARSLPWLEDLRRDVPYALRGLRRTPGFTIAAVLTLGIGIGAATAVVSIVNTILLQPLPYKDAGRLVRVVELVPRQRGLAPARRAVSLDEFREWRARTHTLAGMAARNWQPQVMMPTPQGTVRLSAAMVSPELFAMLGTPAHLGRTLQADDDGPDADVMVLSFETWRRFLQSDPGIVGTSVTLRTAAFARPFTVVGVMPQGFVDPSGDVDVWAPLAARAPDESRAASAVRLASVLATLKPGISLAAAADEANAIGRRLGPSLDANGRPRSGPRRFELISLKDETVDAVRLPLHVLLGAVGVVLLIGCANVASLLLARGTVRQREIAVRLAIGSSRGRIVRQLLTECLLLAGAGGGVGAALGAAGVAVIRSLAVVEAPGVFRLAFGGDILPRLQELHVDTTVLFVAVALSAVTILVFGLAPAIRIARLDHRHALTARPHEGARRNTRMRHALVVTQLALATVLLMGAGLLSNSFLRLTQVDKGYDPTGVLALQLVLPDGYAPARTVAAIEHILQRLRAIPGVQEAGFSYVGVLVGIQNTLGSFVPPGWAVETVAGDVDRPRLKSLSAGYLESIGARVARGRLLTDADGATAAPVVVVNRTVAHRYFGTSDCVGSYMDWHNQDRQPVRVQIVGVIDDVRQGSIDREPYPEIFMDYRQLISIQRAWGVSDTLLNQLAFGFMSFAIRTERDLPATVPLVRQALMDVEPNAGIDAIAPLDHLIASSIAKPRFYAVLLDLFAGVAALLAAIGVYGVLAYTVVQRRQEIGVRMALGAARSQVVKLILWRGLAVTVAGLTTGVAAAAALTRYLSGMLYGVTALDPATYAAVVLLFTLVALVASYLPARRATTIDPIVALRVD